ncbi:MULTISPECIES: SIR2 family protein [unclassified Symbiopectobacterium]|uniref:SIR2 family protein n=1 Tax=unclassified Symbiopectobacterium TaxID=2794573 RepID=UPI0022270114|nr:MULTISPECIES: SIR2 family protein [unclassified Symbiopectobacterium]MCW2473816.1 SIR2 family protein [Candidatus Symbiopectobacterium sp. NZEC151]MCW2482029.1 SIR2 family protein [Candidatus Symbiopectobacterium sp. NZEC135]
MAFDISIFEKKEFRSALNKLEELLSHSKSVLLGAGASACAGLPLTNQLTAKALESDKLSADSKQILNVIQSSFADANPASHIEDYLSELVDWLAITSRRANRGVDTSNVKIGNVEYSNDQLLKVIDEIKLAIFEVINIDIDSEIHERFVKALHRPMRPGKDNHSGTIDYLVMNYDTLIEDSLALSELRYADGLEGGVSGWWSPSTFEQKGLEARVLKLHGSINWVEHPLSSTPLRIAPHLKHSRNQSSKIMIWPASTKYRETQLDPYANLMQRARLVLNPRNGNQRVLLIIGYSFGDAHINLEIDKGLKSSHGNLTIIVFTSDANPTGVLKAWHEDNAISEQVLIFADKGFFHADTTIESPHSIQWWRFEYLTQILEGGV